MGKSTEHDAFLGLSEKRISQKGYHLMRGRTRVNDEIYETEKEAMEAYKNLKDQINVKVEYIKW